MLRVSGPPPPKAPCTRPIWKPAESHPTPADPKQGGGGRGKQGLSRLTPFNPGGTINQQGALPPLLPRLRRSLGSLILATGPGLSCAPPTLNSPWGIPWPHPLFSPSSHMPRTVYTQCCLHWMHTLTPSSSLSADRKCLQGDIQSYQETQGLAPQELGVSGPPQ